jgi:predicted alpha/beta-hydrolase family hydrolase
VSTVTPIVVAVHDPLVDTVTAAVHKSRFRSGIGILLTHGAGGTLDTPGLVALAEVLAAAGHVVVRVNLPHREAGRPYSPRADRAVGPLREVARAVAARVDAEGWVLGGKSYGGRVATMAVADGAKALGVLCYGYPLHPPGKPENPRVEHWPEVDVPVAILQGSRDAFGTPDEILPHVTRFPRRTTLIVVEGGDHSAKVAAKYAPDGKARHERVAIAEHAEALSEWVAQLR